MPLGFEVRGERLRDAALDRVVDGVALLRRRASHADVAARVDVRARGPQEQAPAVDLDVARRLAGVVGLLLAVAVVAHGLMRYGDVVDVARDTGRRRRSRKKSRRPSRGRSGRVRASAAIAYVASRTQPVCHSPGGRLASIMPLLWRRGDVDVRLADLAHAQHGLGLAPDRDLVRATARRPAACATPRTRRAMPVSSCSGACGRRTSTTRLRAPAARCRSVEQHGDAPPRRSRRARASRGPC